MNELRKTIDERFNGLYCILTRISFHGMKYIYTEPPIQDRAYASKIIFQGLISVVDRLGQPKVVLLISVNQFVIVLLCLQNCRSYLMSRRLFHSTLNVGPSHSGCLRTWKSDNESVSYLFDVFNCARLMCSCLGVQGSDNI